MTTTTDSHWFGKDQKLPVQLKIFYDLDAEDKKYADAAKSQDVEDLKQTFILLRKESHHLAREQKKNQENMHHIYEV